MDLKMKQLHISPLNPLKGRIAIKKHLKNLIVNAPLRGLGVNINNKNFNRIQP
jgi:hypothetical protein